MRLACIDIGSNTTRLLVADCRDSELAPVVERRAFTCLGKTMNDDGTIPEAKLAEIAGEVAAQLALAREVSAEQVVVLATAAVRGAANAGALVERVERETGAVVRVLAPEEEARLAFTGAAAMTAERPANGRGPGAAAAASLAVVDLGGGSCEIAVGAAPASVAWSVSLPLGSAELTRRHRCADPPRGEEIDAVRAEVRAALTRLQPPPADRVLAVGGSATSLQRLTGGVLDPSGLEAILDLVLDGPAAVVAARLELDPERVRVLPAGLVVLGELARRFGRPLEVGRGGLREGCLLELARG